MAIMLRLDRLLADAPDRVVALRDGGRITVRKFHADVLWNLHQLKRSDCRRGILIAQDGYCGAVGLFALFMAGIEIVIPQNAQAGTLAQLASGNDLVVTDVSRPDVRNGFVLEIGREQGSERGLLATQLSPDSPITFFTSGSTGRAKPVRKTLAALQAEAAAVEQVLGRIVPASAGIISTVSHQHVYGLAFRLCWPLATGRAFSATTHEIWETALAELQPRAALISSPAHLERLGGLESLTAERRPSLVLSAGAPLSESAVTAVRRVFGISPTEIFGSTETGAVAHRSWLEDDAPWEPLPGLSVARSNEGRLVVRGAHIPAPGEHVGQDLIDLLEDGRFRFRGRADRVIKVEGKRVSLPDVESQLRDLPWIEAAAAVALGDPPSRLGAVVVLTPAGDAKLKDVGAFRFGRALRRELAAKQEPAGLPRQWRFVERLPAGTLGKLQRHDLTALFAPPARERPTEPEICGRRALPDGVELDLHIPADLAQLEGHFPGRPVLAGVVQIDWVVTLAARHLRLPLAAAREFQVKFRTVTTPQMQVTLVLRHLQAKRRLSFEYRAGKRLLTSGSIALEAA